jgi:isoquinoline 1-oxidoreductase beta subunit
MTDTLTIAHTQPHAAGLNRREMLVRTLATGGFALGYTLRGAGDALAQTGSTQSPLTAWILIGSDGTITLQIPATEMGQGIMTGLAQVMADELRVAWTQIKVVHAPVDAAHGGTNAGPYGRFTGGSLSMRLFASGLQQAAANARQMLINAAAARGVKGTLTATNGAVTNAVTTISYAALAADAAAIVLLTPTPLNQYPRLYVGTSARRVDLADKVTGAAQFGIDVFFPGMLFAAVKHCPTIGGAVGNIGSKPAGALAVVPVGTRPGQPNNGVAVVAVTTWDAMNAARSLSVNWTAPLDATSNDTNAINARADWLLANGNAVVAEQSPGVAALATGLAAPNVSIHSTYRVPYIAHAALEPLNCTVRFTPAVGSTPALCEVWAPTQAPDLVAVTAKGLCPAGTTFKVSNTLAGGGFGRKFEQDFIREAVQVALAVPSKAVKLTWPREEDFRYDQFRPMGLSDIQAAALPSTGKITAWRNRVVTPSIATQRGSDPNALDGTAVEGAADNIYRPDPCLVDYVRHDATIPVGYWRSVGLSINVFAVESAIDELAAAIGWDPLEFRMCNLADARMKTVLAAFKTFSGWTTAPAAGRARGLAICRGFGSWVAMMAECSVNATTGVPTVVRVAATVDVGTAINPNAIRGQIEGAVSQSLAVALWQQQTFVNGTPQVKNYNKYRLTKLNDMPQVDVQILEGGGVGGVGELGTPCVAPAIANACARIGGATRHRSLPFFPGTTMGGL